MMTYGRRNLRSLYKAGSLITAAKETAKCELDLVGVQGVAPNQHANIIFSMERRIKIMNYEYDFVYIPVREASQQLRV
jgi:hypothetical protein